MRFLFIPGTCQHSIDQITPSNILNLTRPLPSTDNGLSSPRYTVPLIGLQSTNQCLCGHMWNVAPESRIHESRPCRTLTDKTSPSLESPPELFTSTELLISTTLAEVSFWFLFNFGQSLLK